MSFLYTIYYKMNEKCKKTYEKCKFLSHFYSEFTTICDRTEQLAMYEKCPYTSESLLKELLNNVNEMLKTDPVEIVKQCLKAMQYEIIDILHDIKYNVA